uniref:Uncharacterized protein n=1 Tax=Arundo donax TaxID=35708 RepID=A0A0A9BJ17_ARUDO
MALCNWTWVHMPLCGSIVWLHPLVLLV